MVSRGWPCIDGVRVLILIGWLWGTISSIPKFTNGDFPKPGVLYRLVWNLRIVPDIHPVLRSSHSGRTEQLVNPRRMHMAVNHCYTFQLQVTWRRDWVASAVDTETKSRAHKARITRLLIFDFSDKSRMLGEQRKHKSSFSPPQNHQYETPTSYLAVGVRTIRRQSMQGPSTSFPGCILGCPVAPPV